MNKTNSLIAVVTALSCFACGSSTTINEPLGEAGAPNVGGNIGYAGSPLGETGGETSVSSGGQVTTGGIGTQTGGTGNETQTGGTLPVGGSGTGGSVEPTGGTGPCVPKTCLTIAVELAGGQTNPVPDACGLVNDGCGNLIDCGGCVEGECGEQAGEYKNDNLCGSGCVYQPLLDGGSGCPPHLKNISCPNDLSGYYAQFACNPSNLEHVWCCQVTIDM